jgi:hypothetical protein
LNPRFVGQGVKALGVALAIALAGCGDGGGEASNGGGLEARLFDTAADDVYSGRPGVFALEDFELVPIDTASGDPDGDGIGIAASNERVAIGTDTAWVTDVAEHKALRIDLGTGERQRLDMGDVEPVAVAAEGDRAWIGSDTTLVSFTSDGTPGDLVTLPCKVFDLVSSQGAIWGGCELGLVRVETATNTATLIDVGGEPDSVATTGTSVWALVGGRLVSVSTTGEVGSNIEAPVGAMVIAGEGRDLWVASDPDEGEEPSSMTRHDARTGHRNGGPVQLPGSTDDVQASSAAIAPHRGALWFALAFYGGPLGVIEPART